MKARRTGCPRAGARIGAGEACRQPAPAHHAPRAADLAAALAATAVGWWTYPPVSGADARAAGDAAGLGSGRPAAAAPRGARARAGSVRPDGRVARAPGIPSRSCRVGAGRSRHECAAPASRRNGGAQTPHEMALGVFSLSAMTVSEVMTPRIDIVAVDVSGQRDRGDRDAAAQRACAAGRVRWACRRRRRACCTPRTCCRDCTTATPAHDAWQALIRPAAFVPEAKRLDRQLRDFQRGSGHLADRGRRVRRNRRARHAGGHSRADRRRDPG